MSEITVKKVSAPEYEITMRLTGEEASALRAILQRVGGSHQPLRKHLIFALNEELSKIGVEAEHPTFRIESGGPGAIYINHSRS